MILWRGIGSIINWGMGQWDKMDEYEQRFYNLCLKHNWICNKILEREFKTVDFTVEATNIKFLVEVTHIESEEDWKEGYCYTKIVGKKLREIIDRKKSQIKAHCERECLPILLMVYDESKITHSFQEDVCASMFGELTISFDKKTNKTSEAFHGKKSTIREDMNTSISALGIRNRFSNTIRVYKNPYAKYPFFLDFFKNYEDFDETAFEFTEFKV